MVTILTDGEFQFMNMHNQNSKPGWGILLFALLFPTVVTLVYFVLLAKSAPSAQQLAGGIGKAIQFGLPIFWFAWIRKEKLAWPKWKSNGTFLGTAFGAAVLASMFALYHLWLKPIGFLDATSPAVEQIRAKVAGMGIDSALKFGILGLFYTIVHSGMEEYYWRWFVFGELRKQTKLSNAILISSLGFTAHHVILLGTYFGYASVATWVFSLGIAIGGAFWAWIYNRSESIYPSWLGHMLVDAAIFVIGYDLVKTLWSSP